jgi:hypothetical protein
MVQLDRLRIAALCVFLLTFSGQASAIPALTPPIQMQAAYIVPVVVFGKDSRRSVEDFATEQKLDVTELRQKVAPSGLIECGVAHGAGQLTLANNVVTTAAHVFFDEKGVLRAKTCNFTIEMDGKRVSVPVDLGSIVAGSTNPYAIAAVHDWAVARLTQPIDGVKPYVLTDNLSANTPMEFVARGHIDWGEARHVSIEKCTLHDQLSAGDEGTREFSFDCETGDGASGGAVIFGSSEQLRIGAILVGWRSNRPFRAVPFSPTHYNFAVTIEGDFRKAVVAAANSDTKVLISKQQQ